MMHPKICQVTEITDYHFTVDEIYCQIHENISINTICSLDRAILQYLIGQMIYTRPWPLIGKDTQYITWFRMRYL